MEFDFSTLITDRSSADLSALSALLKKPLEQWTEEETAAFWGGEYKGSYDFSDMNRVTRCMEYLDSRLREAGYESGYTPIEVHSGGVLPSGYVQLEYIQSTGTQYIDTGFPANQNTRIVASMQAVGTLSQNSWLFGVRISNSSAAMAAFWYISNSMWNADYSGSDQRYSFPDIGQTELLNIDFNKSTLTINGTSHEFTPKTFQNSSNLVIFALNTNGTITGNISAKLHSFELYDNDTLIRNLIPCKNDNGVIGLYDAISKQFFGNSGTGVFLPGPEVSDNNVSDSFLWKLNDVPTAPQIEKYLINIKKMRASLKVPVGTPEAPADMADLTLVEANNIELILLAVEETLRMVERTIDLGWALGIAHIGLYGSVS